MELRPRPISVEELPAFVEADAVAFGTRPAPRGVETVASWLELDRTRAVFDGDRLVGASATIGFELTVPGPATVKAAGVTWVGVMPTHRRQGILRAMMASLAADAADRGEPVAILVASEGSLYGRFGYGQATSSLSWEIERGRAALARPGPVGQLELLTDEGAAAVLAPLHDAFRRARPGAVDRSPAWWAAHLRADDEGRAPGPVRFHVVHHGRGGPSGYASYRVETCWEDGVSRARLDVQDLVALDPGAEAALWRYLLALDLVEVVRARGRPVDEALPWMLVDPRSLRVRGLWDGLWLRVLDVPAALAGRRYAVDGEVVLGIEGGGSVRLAGGPGGAECGPAAGPVTPDLSLAPADLGALYLGGVAPSTLAWAGRVVEHRPGALARADAMFAARPAPHCPTHF